MKSPLQFGSGWWFNDTRRGMVNQLNTLADQGLLANFIGMLTDSRSFVSYTRHDYFRRILCDLVGGWVEKGEVPEDRAHPRRHDPRYLRGQRPSLFSFLTRQIQG